MNAAITKAAEPGIAAWLDRLGLVLALLVSYATFLAPFATFRANRIVPGEARRILEALPQAGGLALTALLGASALFALWRGPPFWRLIAAFGGLLAVLIAIGFTPLHLVPEGNSYARVSPGSGFWLLVFAFALMVVDALARIRPRPLWRIALLLIVASGFVVLFRSGIWDDLSVVREYQPRAEAFAREARQHVLLAVGSLAAAIAIGLPLGVLCHRIRALREPVMGLLNVVQTVPSIALFGLLIGPLGWLAANVPGAADLGIRGIGAAPALVALFLYSLLPVVANTAAGLAGVPRAADDAARGLGMTGRQRLTRVELPLALPVILTGIRITLVQNIGLATVAALIGGGGFGTFVFQGIGQTAMDLVLLGALPTVAMAFGAAILLDAAVELSATSSERFPR